MKSLLLLTGSTTNYVQLLPKDKQRKFQRVSKIFVKFFEKNKDILNNFNQRRKLEKCNSLNFYFVRKFVGINKFVLYPFENWNENTKEELSDNKVDNIKHKVKNVVFEIIWSLAVHRNGYVTAIRK
ncbi:hypothetical protein RFI_03852 [Reticulomyxa filosa]|uniref:Uncharacterized protein n=1 Tax=Reticulomyxa filosa TaxID=46433 RepID=X6P558_RETFI|nr:hypothetical protein RFI_03852 [Reticulomyxa filosa]|eukprot:ETO33253.1 hypothetical protein RFI_03852 [Reticulomyxa filosa]